MTEKTTNERALICTAAQIENKRQISLLSANHNGNQGNNCIPYVKAVRDCNEVRTCEELERQRPGGMRGPGKEHHTLLIIVT